MNDNSKLLLVRQKALITVTQTWSLRGPRLGLVTYQPAPFASAPLCKEPVTAERVACGFEEEEALQSQPLSMCRGGQIGQASIFSMGGATCFPASMMQIHYSLHCLIHISSDIRLTFPTEHAESRLTSASKVALQPKNPWP